MIICNALDKDLAKTYIHKKENVNISINKDKSHRGKNKMLF